MLKRPNLFYALTGLVVVCVLLFDVRPEAPSGVPLEVQLKRGPLTIYDYPSARSYTSALILFGSGDGGWGDLEKSICQGLQKKGFHVAGIDCAVYAQSDYSLDILQADYAKIAAMVRKRIKDPQPPLIIGGYSMGAAQAIAAAGGPHPPSRLVGLLVVDPLSRGRYGLREADQLNVLPEGPGTFGADSFAGRMGSLRVVQWHAQNDDIDSHSWLDRLTAPYQFNTFSGAGHLYRVNRQEFVQKLVHSIPWILENNPERTATAATSR